ncbi:hypothetical protein CTI12_AA526100 [Artemisia annua]|uniref:Calmodulin-binding domain-containing protein n=1 Tax=Artemisia annua TaxID=35608 RepID=A0A2U1L3C0_ARTAN|nr:hypothetical protein CTI12_AA526100 [Artemisia annua]
MSGAHIQGQVTTGMDQSVESCARITCTLQKQLELMNEYKETMVGQTQEQFESTGELVKNLNCDLEGKNTDEIAKVRGKVAMEQDAAVTPTIMNPSMAQGKQVDQARSIAEKLDFASSSSLRGSSGCLLWFANIVTSVNADDLAIGQKNKKEMQMPSQHGKCLTPKKAYVDKWGTINKGKRSRRALLCIGMEKNVHSKHSRRHSTGNFFLESNGYEDVLSRYLSGPFPSCHDHCKPHLDQSNEPKSTPPTHRSKKAHIDSVKGNKKNFTPIPRSPTKHAKVTNTSVVKHQSSVKTAGDGMNSKKVQTSKSRKNTTNPEVDQNSINSNLEKPVVEVVQEKADQTQSVNEEKALENSQNGPQMSSTSKKVEILPSDSQNSSSIAASGVKKIEKLTRVGKLVKENETSSSQKLKFRHGKTTNGQSESGGPRQLKFGHGKCVNKQSENGPGKVKFNQGKVLDKNHNGVEDSASLRRMSSDGILPSQESSSVDVVLKQCDQEVNKSQMRTNNVIEEAASKLIRARKSKVQALVGAFEMISTNDF